MSVQVYVENDQNEVPVDGDTIRLIESVIAQAAAQEHLTDGEVSVVLKIGRAHV